MDWRGFELHPETPEGGIAIERLFGPGRAEGMEEYLQGFAAQFGISNMRQPRRIPNTRRALAAAEYARDRGRLDAFRETAMDAYWQEGADLEDGAVIRRVAERAGLDPDATEAAMDDERCLERVDAMRREADEAGVTGIPTFFIGDRMVVGCQPYETLAAAAEEAGAVER